MLTGALSLIRPFQACRLQTHPGSSMTDAPNTPADNAAAQAPQLRVLAQYVKDLSFENPGAPETLRPGQQAPAIDLAIDVQARGELIARRDHRARRKVFHSRGLLVTAESTLEFPYSTSRVKQSGVKPPN